MTKNKALYGLPEDVKFCSKCVISNQRPSSVVEFKQQITQIKPTIEFDDKNVCSACLFQEKKKNIINWKDREKELIDLLDRFRRKDGSFDCIVPGSGGKDSRYVSHILKYKYNMNPLTVTWTPHDYTDIGRFNFESWHEDGFSNILLSPNRKLHKYLTKEAFKNLLHPFQPFIVGQRISGALIAKKYKIPLIFYGENQAEYGNNISENDTPFMKEDFFSSNNDLHSIYLSGKTISQHLEENSNFRVSDFNFYLPLDDIDFDIKYAYLGYFINWDPQEVYYYTVENTGFRPSTFRTPGSFSRYSSIDDKIDLLHYYTTYIKFGIGRATYDAAQEIRNNKITREEGISLVKKFDHELDEKKLLDCLDYMDIKIDDFQEIIDKGRSPHLWKKNNNKWELLHKVY